MSRSARTLPGATVIFVLAGCGSGNEGETGGAPPSAAEDLPATYGQVLAPQPSGETPGATAGDFAVGPQGAATYSIPIVVAPGTAGMKPALSVSYSSHAGNGVFGQGFALEGLSSISRCPRTIAQDGLGMTHALDINDRFCLDGQRLVAVAGTYGADGTQYRTEIESFSKVVSFGSLGGGPSHFRVWTRSGQILDYGSSEDARSQVPATSAVRVWAVKRIADRRQNYLEVDYYKDDSRGEIIPTVIRYTGNTASGLVPGQRVAFHYEGRPDVAMGYSAGARVSVMQRVLRIETYDGANRVRDYVFAYDQGGIMGRSRLVSVKECGGPDGAQLCFKPTTFTWKNVQTPGTSLATWGSGMASNAMPGDFNGDGRTDLVQISGNQPFVALSTGSGFAGFSSWGSGFHGTPKVADLNGDGRTDLLDLRSDGTAYAWLSQGQSFTTSLWGSHFSEASRVHLGDFDGDGRSDAIDFRADGNAWVWMSGGASAAGPVTWGIDTGGTPADVRLGDFDGDGRSDVLRVQGGNFRVWRSIGNQFAAQGPTWGSNPYVTSVGLHVSDVNGDGLSDIVWFGGGHAYVWPSSGTQFHGAEDWGIGFTDKDTVADMNGDGRADALQSSTVDVKVSFSSGSKFIAFMPLSNVLSTAATQQVTRVDTRWHTPGGYYLMTYDDFRHGPEATCWEFGYAGSTGNYQCGAVVEESPARVLSHCDWEGNCRYKWGPPCTYTPYWVDDGYYESLSCPGYTLECPSYDSEGGCRTMVPIKRTPDLLTYRHNGAWYMAIGGGQGWCQGTQYVAWLDCWRWAQPTETINFGLQLGDFDGDGLTDVIQLGPGATMQVGRNNSGVADLLSAVSDGLATSVSVVYAGINDASVHAPESSAVYPMADLRSGFNVVRFTYASNSTGGTNQTTHSYQGAKKDAHGRGFVGFTLSTVRDEAAQVTSTSSFHTAFPYTGLLSYKEKRAGAAKALIAQAWSSFSDQSSFNGTVHLPVQGGTHEKTFDLNGTPTQIVDTSMSDFFYGNPRSVWIQTSDGTGTLFAKHTVSTYADADEGNWILLRLTGASVTSIAPNVPSLTRSTSYTYDPDGLLKEEIREPYSAVLRLTTTHEYDAYGNEIKTTLTPNDGQAPRSIRKVFSADGRFPIESYNAREHKTTRTFDGRFGAELSVTDPNGLVTWSQYDHLGRRMSETKPDGLAVSTTLAFCSGATCPVGAAYMRETVANRPAPRARHYYDKQNVEIGSATEGFDGRWIATMRTLDALGRMVEVTRPYFALPDGFTPEAGPPPRTATQFDALGRPTVVTAPDGGVTRHGYNGLQTSVTNAKNQTTTTKRNLAGHVESVTDTTGHSVTYRHDAHGNPTHVFRPHGFVITNDYDVLGRKTRMVDPDAGTSTFVFNSFAEVTHQTDGKGQTTSMVYDQIGRVVTRTEAEGTSKWAYDTSKKGLLSRETVSGAADSALPSTSRSYSYDHLARLTSEQLIQDSRKFITRTKYDSNGRVASVLHPASLAVSYAYNSRGYLESLARNASSTPYWKALAANADGQITQERFGNGLVTTRTFNPLTGRIEKIETPTVGGSLSCVPAACTPDPATWNPNTKRDAAGCFEDPDSGTTTKLPDACAQPTPQSYQVAFDVLGNLTERRDNVAKLTETFSYDVLNRLETVSGASAKTLTYDELGRIVTKTGVGTYSYSASKPSAVTKISGAVNTDFSYDGNGNMTAGNGRLLTWTSFDRPRRVENHASFSEWTYDAGHARIRQKDSAGKVTYYAGDYEQVHAGAQITNVLRIRAPHGHVAEVQASAAGQSARYFLTDHLGSVQVVTDQAGSVLQRLSYDAHGKRRFTTGADDTANSLRSRFTTRGFSGHEALDDLGLVHMNARLYDPLLGRFLSADPIVQLPWSTQGYDRYQYAGNNPLSYVDPTGHGFLKKIFRAVVAIVAAIVVTVALPILAPALVAAFPAVVPIAAGFVGGLVAGGFKGAVFGALSGGVFHGIGFALANAHAAVRVAVHGLASGALAEMQGGEFRYGFISGAFRTAAFVTVIDKLPALAAEKVLATAAVGGLAAKLAGGKFENGAVTAAFATMFNDLAHPASPEESNATDGEPPNWLKRAGKLFNPDPVRDPIFEDAQQRLRLPADPGTYEGRAELMRNRFEAFRQLSREAVLRQCSGDPASCGNAWGRWINENPDRYGKWAYATISGAGIGDLKAGIRLAPRGPSYDPVIKVGTPVLSTTVNNAVGLNPPAPLFVP